MTPSKGTLLKSMLTVTAITAVTLVLLELALRASGAMILSYQTWMNPKINLHDVSEYRVVTLGESTTAQFWSEGRELSWPGQLERNLNALGLKRHFKVFNLSRGGSSSPFQVEKFKQQVAELHPHLVISMLGINDSVHFEYAHGTGWKSLRIYKVWRWLVDWRSKPWQPLDSDPGRPPSFREIENHVASLMHGLWTAPETQLDHIYQSVRQYASQRTTDEQAYALGHAAALFLIPAHSLPGSEADHSRLLAKMAFKCAKESLAVQPTNTWAAEQLTYAALILRKYSQNLKLLHRAMDGGMRPNSTLYSLLGHFGDKRLEQALQEEGLKNAAKDFYRITFENYRNLAEVARSNHIHYIAMQYPTGKAAALENIFSRSPDLNFAHFGNSLYHEFPALNRDPNFADVITVSNENFNEAIAKSNYDEYFKDRFSAYWGGRFGHTTTKGHALIAENLTRAISEHWSELSK